MSRRTSALRAGAVLLGLALLGVAELAARWSGRFDNPPAPALPPDWGEGVRLVDNRTAVTLEPTTVGGAPGLQTPRRLVQSRIMQDVAWRTAPDPTRPRVFAFGGSTTYGVPIEREPGRTFPGRLASWLEATGTPAEVINLGGASYGSDQTVQLMRAVVGQHAQVWIAYDGNNEFFQYNLSLFEMNARFPTTRVNLRQLYLFRALEAALAPTEPVPAVADARARQDEQMARLVEATLVDPAARPAVGADGGWHRRDAHARAVFARVKANLDQMEALAGTAGATLLVVDVRPNLQQPPYLSLHDPAVSAVTRWRVADLLKDAAAAQQTGDLATAAALAQQAVDLDPMYAAAWHTLGMVQLARVKDGDLAPAERALHNALELDMSPGRPLDGIRAAVGAATADGGSIRVDLDPLWRSFEGGPFGGRLYHDACHLTPAAYDQLGALLAAETGPLLTAAP